MKTRSRRAEPPDDATDRTPRAGTCALVGRPNVGKSTLLNALLGERLAIATATPQTTRAKLLGVVHLAEPPTQVGFLDTPGLHAPQNALGRALVIEASGAIAEADVVVMLTDVSTRAAASASVREDDEPVLAAIGRARGPVVLAINKVDRLRDKGALLPLIEAYSARHPFAAVVPISATRSVGLDALIGEVRARLPEGRRWEEDTLTDRPERFFAIERVREAVIARTRQELPHAVAVTLDRWQEPVGERGITRIEATIHVEKPGQKGIVIGAGGTALRAIGERARLAIESFLGRRVFLGLHVRVTPGWTRDPKKARELGLGGDVATFTPASSATGSVSPEPEQPETGSGEATS